MPGFLITNMSKNPDLSQIEADNRVYKNCRISTISIQTSTLNKFENDKVFNDTNDSFIVTEGLLLNSGYDHNSQEVGAYPKVPLYERLITGIKEDDVAFFSTLYGSYSGAYLDKTTHTLTAWTNHTGDSAVFWYYDENSGLFAVGSQFDFVLDTLKVNNIRVSFDEMAAYSLLTYAFMCDERTCASEIKRLFPGTCIKLSLSNSCKPSIETYWRLTNNKFDLSRTPVEEIIDTVDNLFREGISLEFNKDCEYDYLHFANISGGFDARMVNFVARDLNFSPVLNTHYSQSGSLEQKLSKRLARLLNNEIIVQDLDNIEFIYDIDELVKMNYGLAIYSGSTGGRKMLESIDMSIFGCEHTGMIGDVVIGTFMNDPNTGKDDPLQFLYSNKIKSRLSLEHIQRYDSMEMQLMYIRALLGACTSYQIRKYYTEPISVFMYPPLLEYCMSIPVELRRNHKLYFKWILEKYPDAAKVPWDHIDAKITTPAKIAKLGHYIKRLPAKVLSKLHIKADNYGMNPHEYWYATKPEFREFCRKYFDENINKPIFSDELKNDMKYLFETGNTIEKLQVMTVLAVGKNYFS